MLVAGLDIGDLADDVVRVDGLVAEMRHDLGGLGSLALLDQESRALVLEEAQDEDQAGEHDVEGGGDDPLVVALVADVSVGTVVGEVSENNAFSRVSE